MQNSVDKIADQHGNTSPSEPPKFSKRIGSTVYNVSVYFSQTSQESIEDKLLRLIKKEVRNSV